MNQPEAGSNDVKTTPELPHQDQPSQVEYGMVQGSLNIHEDPQKSASNEDEKSVEGQAETSLDNHEEKPRAAVTLQDVAENGLLNMGKNTISSSKTKTIKIQSRQADESEAESQDEEIQEQHWPENDPKEDGFEITEKTRKMYMKNIRSMEDYSNSLVADNEYERAIISPVQMVEDMASRQDISDGTKRTYRASMLWWFNKFKEHEPYQEGLAKLEQWYEDHKAATRGQKKKSNKKRSVPEDDFNRLASSLGASRSEWARKAQLWIDAGMITGLRPIEWFSAKWIDDEKTHLLVQNAKVKLDRPGILRDESRDHYDYEPILERIVPVDEESDRIIVEEHMLSLDTFCFQPGLDPEARYMRYNKEVRQAINRECKKIWKGKKSYTLYDMRRQFSANMKAEFGREVTAKLMGHSDPTSKARKSYGKANQAFDEFKKKGRPSDYNRNTEERRDDERDV